MSPHLSQREKFQDSIFHWKMHSHSFLELNRHHSPEVHGQRYDYQLQDLHTAPQINRVHHGKKPMLLQHCNTRPHTTAATSVTTENTGFEVVPHPPYCPDLAPRGCCGKWFQKQPEDFYSDGFEGLVHCWWRVRGEEDYVEKWGTETKYTFWAMKGITFWMPFVTVPVQLVSFIKELPQYLHIHFISFI
jgi:hypothetical protein